jgi:hypothetical protein
MAMVKKIRFAVVVVDDDDDDNFREHFKSNRT